MCNLQTVPEGIKLWLVLQSFKKKVISHASHSPTTSPQVKKGGWLTWSQLPPQADSMVLTVDDDYSHTAPACFWGSALCIGLE